MLLTLGFWPATSLETAIRVHEEEVGGQELQHGSDTVLDLLLTGDTRRVDVIDTRANFVRVAELLEGVQDLEVRLGGFNGDDIGIERLDGREDVVEVGVAEVRVGLERVGNTSSGELERREGPVEVGLPVSLAERKLWRQV